MVLRLYSGVYRYADNYHYMGIVRQGDGAVCGQYTAYVDGVISNLRVASSSDKCWIIEDFLEPFCTVRP